MLTDTISSLTVERVRHPVKLRRLRVQYVERISPHFLRIRFEGDDLADFVSASFDDHIKLMLPNQPGSAMVLPATGPDGPASQAGAERPTMRDYTPCHFDPAAGTLDIEFFLHPEGFATEWAAQAKPGDEVGVGGPRGSFVVPMGFDRHLLIGDETALPAIARRLDELPEGASVVTVIETADPGDRRRWATRASVQAHWLQSGAVDTLAQAVSALVPRASGEEMFAWAAGEAASMAAVRQVLLERLGLHKSCIRASAYWKRGSAGHHEAL